MTSMIRILSAGSLFVTLSISGTAAEPEVFQGDKADAKIREFMKSDWHRQKWQIEKKPRGGQPEADHVWQVKGTMWTVSLKGRDISDKFDLEKLDPAAVYEFRGVPVDQCYGVVTFYLLTGLHKMNSKEAEQDGTGQPATRPELKSEGSDKPQPESEGRSR